MKSLFRLFVFTLLCNALFAHAETWNLAVGGSWNVAANWNPASVPNAIGANATFNNAASGSSPAQTANSPVTLDGSKTVGSINFNNDEVNAFTYAINTGSGGPLVFDETDAGPATITVNSISGATGNNTILVATILTDSLVVTVNNVTATSGAGALNLTTAMSGPGGFTKQGDGLATFGTGAKTYTGATVLSGGRMRMSAAAHPSATSSFTINSGAQLTLLAAGGTFTFGSGSLNLNGSGATSGPFAVFPGAIRNESGAPATINNAVVLQSDTLLHVQATGGTGGNPTPTGSLTLVNTVSGPGSLTLTAPGSNIDQGSLILNGNNTYQGGTFVNGGILVASGSAATFGIGNVTVDNAASFASIARLTIQSGVLNAIADTATLSLAGGGSSGVADRGYAELGAGVNEVVGELTLAGEAQAPGTYGSTASTATFQNDEFFAGTGIATVAAAGPRLAITLNPPNVIVSWPTNATGFTLEQRPDLNNTSTWTTNMDSVVVVGTNNTVTINAGAAAQFFRLKK